MFGTTKNRASTRMVDMIPHNFLFYKRRLFCYQYGNYTFQHGFGGSLCAAISVDGIFAVNLIIKH